MAGIVALGIGVFSAASSAVSTIDANNQASKTQQEEQQLLNEAKQAGENQKEQGKLISQRTAQEQQLNPVAGKWSGSGTILTGPLGVPSASKASGPTQLLGT